MKVIFISNDSREADLLKSELIAHSPPITLEQITPTADGMIPLADIGTTPADLIIIDAPALSDQLLKAIKDVHARMPGVSAIILTNPGDEDAAIEALKAGAANCIDKTEKYFLRLIPAIERELRIREQAREKASLKSREERLRQIVEMMPAGIAVIAPDGTCLAINRIGLSAIGATHIEQIVGKNFLHLVPAGDREKIQALLISISSWNTAFARLSWKGLDESVPGVEIRAVPMRREGIGTAAALAAFSVSADSHAVSGEMQKKCDDLTKALQESEALIRELQDTRAHQQSQMESALRQAESRCLTAEEQQARLKGIAEETEARLQQLLEEQRAERASWELTRKAFKEQCTKIEAVAQSLISAQASLAETHSAEQEQWNLQRRELEQKIEAAEARFNQASESFQADRPQLELAQKELEQRYRDAEEQRNNVQNALQEMQSRLSRLTEEYATERSQFVSAWEGLEQKCRNAEEQKNALQAALNDAESRHNDELSQRDLIQKELEAKHQAAVQQQTALQNSLNDAEVKIAQLLDKHNTELSQYEFAQRKAEQKYQAAENQRISLLNDLHQAEGKLAHLEEKYDAERARWDSDRTELEQRFQTAEKEHAAALQNAARETESRLAWISEQNQAKALQLEKMQGALEQLEADCKRFAAEAADFRNRYQRLMQFTAAGIVLAKRDGTVLECNDLAARMFGYSGSEDALAQSGENRFQIYAFEGALDARLLQEGKLENIVWSSLGCDGRVIRIQECASLIETSAADGPLVERILTDLSKIRKIDEEKLNAHKTDFSGDLASAAAKSYKDLCASLAHTGELLMATPDDGNAVRRVAETLLNDATRGIRHAHQFLAIAQKAERVPTLLNLNEIILTSDLLLHCIAGDDIDLKTVLAPRIGLVSTDRSEVIQLIGNLLINARETLPLGGAVTIETSHVEIASPAAGLPAGLQPGIYVRLQFSADGCALQPERRNVSIRAIVDRMGGRLETTNDPRFGNIHKIYLPRIEPFASQAGQMMASADAG